MHAGKVSTRAHELAHASSQARTCGPDILTLSGSLPRFLLRSQPHSFLQKPTCDQIGGRYEFSDVPVRLRKV